MIYARKLDDMGLYRHRVLEISSLLAERSLFLFGPRQTGKSSYVQNQLSGIPALSYNLLDTRILLRFLARPSILREEIVAKDLRDRVVFIDEIQKCPPLLDEVHLLIEERNIRFLLTGSSARKLKAVGTNLLGGRARTRYLHPFVFPEVSGDPDFFNRALLSGFIPPHYLSNSPEEDLRSYVGTYLQEEIAAEGLARNLSAFSRFLETASTLNAKLINYTNVANDAQVPRPTVRLWFQILYDTMIAYELPSFTSTLKRKAISTAKFYFFDIGVTRMLRRIPPPLPESSDFGELFEQYIFLELKAYIDYFQPGSRITYWRSTSGYEVDFIINKDIAIEVKTAQLLQERHLTGLQALREENLIKRFICVCREDRPRWINGILVLPWQEFLQRLWAKELF